MIKLDCSQAYWEATEEVRNIVANGCGPGGWKLDLVPDNLLGLDISECCRIHDWDYAVGETEADKIRADHRLHRNMRKLIRYTSHCAASKIIRYAQADGYFEAVSHGGSAAFWANKVKPEPLNVN